MLGEGRAPSDDGSELERRASYLADRGDYAAALEVQRLLVEERERSLGAEHPATLTARASLAHWTGKAGDAAGARDQFAALVPASERVLGPEHPDSLTDRANLAAWTGGGGGRGRGP